MSSIRNSFFNALFAAYKEELISGEHTRHSNDHDGALSLYIETREQLKHDHIKVLDADYADFEVACNENNDEYIQAFENRMEAQMQIAERCVVDYIVNIL